MGHLCVGALYPFSLTLVFGRCALGKHAFSTMVKAMCAESGIEGKSNHSLRVAGATRMFTAGIPEKIIQQRTDHSPQLLKSSMGIIGSGIGFRSLTYFFHRKIVIISAGSIC